MSSDTPRTDCKSFIAFDTEGRKLTVVLAATSEQLERERGQLERDNYYLKKQLEMERDFAKRMEEQYVKDYSELADRFDAVTKERDDKIADIQIAANRIDELKRRAEHWCDMHTVAARERDELKQENAELNTLFDIQRKRTKKADKMWQESTGETCLPDLGPVD